MCRLLEAKIEAIKARFSAPPDIRSALDIYAGDEPRLSEEQQARLDQIMEEVVQEQWKEFIDYAKTLEGFDDPYAGAYEKLYIPNTEGRLDEDS